ncbi:MAG: hypothetical protein M0042_16650 [Nitrospiraceae bacterium]|nr:hypothetical protein [Nitrospiraceae bacterium]
MRNIILAKMLGVVLVAGCSVDKIEPPQSGIGMQTAAPITSGTQGVQAVSEVMQASELAFNTAMVMKIIGSHGNNIIAMDPNLAQGTTGLSCPDYGGYTYSGTTDANGNYTLKVTYALCRENGYQFDGDVNVKTTSAGLAVDLATSGNVRIVDFNWNYSTINGIIRPDKMTFTIAQESASSNVQSYTIKPSGYLTAFDYVMLGQNVVVFTGVQMAYTKTIGTAASGDTTQVVANGQVRETLPSGTIGLNYVSFAVEKKELPGAVQKASQYTTGDVSVTGDVQFDFASSTDGVEGNVTVVTSSPVHYSYQTSKTSAGQVTVTGSGSAVATYDAGGGVGVTVAGANAGSFASEYALFKEVNMYGLEQAQPDFQGQTGTITTPDAIVPKGSKWPATMTVTALSSGPDLNCYTDVHVLYFSPSDAATRKITWYVDWAIGLVDGCKKPAGIPFEEARDINGDGYCDVGLDINGADQDITSGGVEHFTATVLPEGYYVLAIDNYSCATSVSNMASIIIGDYTFGTYTCSYTGADGDGSDPGSWCRLADVLVNADGSFVVKAPDSSFNPWHN